MKTMKNLILLGNFAVALLITATAQQPDTAKDSKQPAATTPNTGSIDQAQFLALELHLGVNAIASRPRYLAHNGALLSQDGVEERGLTDVGASYDGNAYYLLFFLFIALLIRWWKRFYNEVEQITGTGSL